MCREVQKHSTMRMKASNLVIPTLALIAVSVAIPVMADSAVSRENKIKAAFLYNFMDFVDWPKARMADVSQPIIVGVIGSRDFLKVLEPLKQKKIKGKRIVIRYFPGYEKLKKSDDPQWNKNMQALKACHTVLLCACDPVSTESQRQIIKALKDSPVLTVSEMKGFLEAGGIINFLVDDEKVRFEINNAAARQNGLRISSKLLRLAKRVID